MRIYSRNTLRTFWERHATTEDLLKAWFKDTEQANWAGPQDIKNRYATASFVGTDRVVFNIGGNNYRLIVKIRYEAHAVYIRFIGTHAEYNRIKAEEV